MDDPWPLDIMDHEHKAHKLVIEPGDLVWYEGSRYAFQFLSFFKRVGANRIVNSLDQSGTFGG